MRLEFTADVSEFEVLASARRAGRIDGSALAGAGAAAEAAGIDGVLIEDPTGSQDVAALASYVLHATSTLNVAIQHAAGIIPPEIAARQIATLDQLSGGRITVHIDPPGGEPVVLRHEESLARLDEYIMLLKRLWSNAAPIDFEGSFHRLEAAVCGSKPFRDRHVPIAFAGLSGTAIKVAARHADLFVLPAGTLEETRRTIERVRAAAACHRRAEAIRFCYPIRPQLAPGTAEAIAGGILDYCQIGVTDFIVGGLRSAAEIAAFGKAVTPLVRRALAQGGAVSAERGIGGVAAATHARAWGRRGA